MPDLYKLAVGKKFTVARMLSKHRRNYLNFFMPFDPNAPTANNVFHQLLDFNSIMDDLVPSPENDSISWFASSDNLYSVKYCYGLLNDGGLRSMYGLDIWKCIAPP